MNPVDRPTQISAILKTLGSGDDAEISTELEAYIADLEAKQPHRPTRIATILAIISSQHPADIGTPLEAYITELETAQQVTPSSGNGTVTWDHSNPPFWSDQRLTEREQRRRKRAIRKQNYYQ